MLKSAKSFPNQPDVLAKMAGYPDAKAVVDEEEASRQRAHEAEIARADRQSALLISERAQQQRGAEEGAATAKDNQTKTFDRQNRAKRPSKPANK